MSTVPDFSAIALRLRDLRDDLARAAVFLTRLPIPAPAGDDPAALGRALRLAPLVGLGVGALAGAVYAVAAGVLGLPALAAAGLAVAASFWLTGGLHEDGLGDVADGFGGGTGAARKLAIMRDSRVGSYAVAAIALSLGLRAAALAALAPWPQAVLGLVAAHALSRAPLAAVMHALPPARADGLGAGAGRPERTAAATGLGLGAIAAVLALGAGPGLIAILLALFAVGAAARLAVHQVGGYTGDVLGMLQQVAEVLVLLAAAALLAP